MPVVVKRVYEMPTRRDGTRVLVDRLWPRGLTRERASVYAWLRDLAPSDALRHWFHARPQGWFAFRKRYLRELARPESEVPLQKLYDLVSRRPTVTLLYASSNQEHNNAVVLKELLEGLRKPPTGTGPKAVRALRERQAKRMPR